MKLTDWSASAQRVEPERGYLLKLAAIHDDSLPQEWITQVSHRAIQLVGPRCVRSARWTVEALHEPGVLREAIEAAIEADILAVSVCATGELPLDLNRWIDAWLPCRLRRVGALVAVIGVPHAPTALAVRIREYLRDVASLAHLEFLPQERRLPAEQSGFSGEDIPKATQVSPQVLKRALHRRRGLHSRAGRPDHRFAA